MSEEIASELGTFRNFETSVTLASTLNLGQSQTIVNHSWNLTHTPSFIHIGRKICGRTDIEPHFIRSFRRNDLTSSISSNTAAATRSNNIINGRSSSSISNSDSSSSSLSSRSSSRSSSSRIIAACPVCSGGTSDAATEKRQQKPGPKPRDFS